MWKFVVLIFMLPAALGASQPMEPVGSVASPLSLTKPAFVENLGQWDAEARFCLQTSGLVLWFTADRLVLQPATDQTRPPLRSVRPVTMYLSGGTNCRLGPDAPSLSHVTNYMFGNRSDRWVSGARSYDAIRHRDLAPGIDLKFYVVGGELEYDFILSPGADASMISVFVHGTDSLAVLPGGDLALFTSWGVLRQTGPLVYQESTRGTRPLAGHFVVTGKSTFGFETESAVDPGVPVVIDPVLKYSTYLGGGQTDAANAVATDFPGNAYVTGYTNSSDFPVVGGYDPTYNRGTDVFVARFSSNGADLVYCTFIGGLQDDNGRSIAADPAGNVYVCGSTASSDFPVVNAYDAGHNGEEDAFVLKLSSSGSVLEYGTFLGGLDIDIATAVAITADNRAWVTGRTESVGFPTVQAVDPTFNGGVDAFVSRLSPTGGQLEVSTFLGGSGVDQGRDIAMSGPDVIVAGLTTSSAFPTIPGAFDISYNGQTDLFVARYAVAGTAMTLARSTFVGGTGVESEPVGVAIRETGEICLAGNTSSGDYPLMNPYDATAAASEAVVTVLDADLSTLLFSTYLGGSAVDVAQASAVDADGDVYVAGWTMSADFPVLHAVDSSAVLAEAFVARFRIDTPDLVYSTLFGGSGTDLVNSIAIDGAGAVIMAGQTGSTNLPLERTWDATFNGGTLDAFIAKIAGVTTACCLELRGNVDDEGGENPNVSDLTYLVSYLFKGGTPPPCPQEANVDGSTQDQANVNDLTFLVNYLFKSGPTPAPCP